MSRVAYFDCASGASGDMLLGALVDLGLPLDRLRAELAKLPLSGYGLEARKVERAGLVATKVDIRIENGKTDGNGDGDGHEHQHDHEHDHEHEHEHEHEERCPRQPTR